jgi:hypothetical protein
MHWDYYLLHGLVRSPLNAKPKSLMIRLVIGRLDYNGIILHYLNANAYLTNLFSATNTAS